MQGFAKFGFGTKHVKLLHIVKNYVAIASIYIMPVETCPFIFISVALVESDPWLLHYLVIFAWFNLTNIQNMYMTIKNGVQLMFPFSLPFFGMVRRN